MYSLRKVRQVRPEPLEPQALLARREPQALLELLALQDSHGEARGIAGRLTRSTTRFRTQEARTSPPRRARTSSLIRILEIGMCWQQREPLVRPAQRVQ